MSAVEDRQCVARRWPTAQSFDVALIGGGFAGTAVAVQLARLATHPLRIVIFDRAGAFGRGVAYSPDSDYCLLNVRAKAMGAFPDAEDDFLRWLLSTGYAAGESDWASVFCRAGYTASIYAVCSIAAPRAARPSSGTQPVLPRLRRSTTASH